MKVCYCDESGTGDEPIAVMTGIVVDSTRMHVTKEHWSGLLADLSKIARKPILELHTRHFYRGSGPWSGVDGEDRSKVISLIFNWLSERKHHIVFSSVMKEPFFEDLDAKKIPPEIKTLWQFLAFHIVLSIQKSFKNEKKPKGHTIFVFDDEHTERIPFPELIKNPPEWSDEYYNRGKKEDALSLVVDTPFFVDSKNVALIQVADFLSFFLRRFVEIETGLIPEKYAEERRKIGSWVKQASKRCISLSHIYPAKKRNPAADLFSRYAPDILKKK